jgi:hypothetical protein
MADSMATVMKLLRLVNDKEKNHTLVMSDVAAKMKNNIDRSKKVHDSRHDVRHYKFSDIYF